MEEVILNPGYHYIAEKILSNLNSESLFSLSQTNKEIMKACERFMISKGRKNSIFEGTKCQSCLSIFQGLVTFVKENDIYYFGYFTSIEPNSQKEKILLQFVQILYQLIDRLRISGCIQRNRNRLIADCKCSCKIGFIEIHIKQMARELTQKYVRFIPPNCPYQSKPHLRRLLREAIYRRENLDMAKTLLAAMKNQDTCLRLTISAIDPFIILRYRDSEIQMKRMNDVAAFIEKIASQCKNPNAPNKFGSTALHLAAKFELDKIAKVLVPYCNNLDARNKNGKTALDIAKEKGDFEIEKILKSAIRGRSLKNLMYESEYKDSKACLA